MVAKKVLRGALLAFVAVAVGFLVLKEMRTRAAGGPAAPMGGVAAGGAAGAPENGGEDREPPRRVVAYYFHQNKRCNTCRTIERLAREAIETGFPELLMSGRLEWRSVNLDDPGNDHYYGDFHLTGSGLVLVDLVDGKPSRFKQLTKTWDLFADAPAFAEYVQAEARAYLESPQ